MQTLSLYQKLGWSWIIKCSAQAQLSETRVGLTEGSYDFEMQTLLNESQGKSYRPGEISMAVLEMDFEVSCQFC